MRVASSLLRQVNVEALYYGNVSLSDAKEAEQLIHRSITSPDSTILPKKKVSLQQVIKLPRTHENPIIIAPTKDTNEPNTAVEMYFQFGTDGTRKRVLVDLLEHIIYEPLFDSLRTKEQFGYQVSAEIRWTYGVIGMSFRVVTACKSAVSPVPCIVCVFSHLYRFAHLIHPYSLAFFLFRLPEPARSMKPVIGLTSSF